MIDTPFARLITQDAPGEFRAALLDSDGRASALFAQRWGGAGDRARYGDIIQARIRSFSEEVSGAFVELRNGEEALLRFTSKPALTEGAIISVEVRSEARIGKLARVALSDGPVETMSAFARWQKAFPGGEALAPEEDPNCVDAQFDDLLHASSVLPGGGRLTVEQTRALFAFDIDTAGRVEKGSAGARALKVNRSAVSEMARQISVRGLGGLMVVDCVGPLNNAANDRIRQAARDALAAYGIKNAKVLKPSALGLLEASVPWRFMPMVEQISADPGEAELLTLLRDLQRAARATPSALYTLSLGGPIRSAYVSRKADVTAALETHFSGRVQVSKSEDGKSEFRLR